MTQPLLLAAPDSDIAPVTEGGIIVCPDTAERCAKAAETLARADIAEFRCAEQLTQRGYSCTVLGGRFKGFDIIADRDDIWAQHVQVKHGFLTENRYIIKNRPGDGPVYSPTAYDILVYYMWDRDQWLVYGRAEFGDMSGISYVPPDLRKNARYRRPGPADRNVNNWEYFDQLATRAHQKSFTPKTAVV
jgi:hypothetical protein